MLEAADAYWAAMNRYDALTHPDEQDPSEIREAVRQLRPATAAYNRALSELGFALRSVGQLQHMENIAEMCARILLTMRDINKSYPED